MIVMLHVHGNERVYHAVASRIIAWHGELAGPTTVETDGSGEQGAVVRETPAEVERLVRQALWHSPSMPVPPYPDPLRPPWEVTCDLRNQTMPMTPAKFTGPAASASFPFEPPAG